jgi:DNA-binding LacI/PurR family transcriptional regulator
VKRQRHTTRVRLVDVANAVGVSTAVVSHTLSDRTHGTIRVSEATRQRVLRAVRELGYVPNPIARRLARGRTGLIGVFTYEPVFPIDQTNFFHPFLVGIEAEAETQGQDLLLFTKGADKGTRNIYVDGVNRLQLADGAVLF